MAGHRAGTEEGVCMETPWILISEGLGLRPSSAMNDVTGGSPYIPSLSGFSGSKHILTYNVGIVRN